MPHSRPMPAVGPRCHELRVVDRDQTWRIGHRIDVDAVIILDVFKKQTRATPPAVIAACRARLTAYERDSGRRHS